MISISDQILNVAKESNRTILDTCTQVLNFIMDQDESHRLDCFSAFLSRVEIRDVVDLEKPQDEYFSEDLLSKIEGIQIIANQILEGLLRENTAEDTFYETLWNKLCDPVLFHDQSEQTAFLVWLWINPYIPYYQLKESCKMNDEKFSEITRKILPKIKKADFILVAPLSQKTQRASLLMQLADELSDKSEKIVLWAHILSNARSLGFSEADSPDEEETV